MFSEHMVTIYGGQYVTTTYITLVDTNTALGQLFDRGK